MVTGVQASRQGLGAVGLALGLASASIAFGQDDRGTPADIGGGRLKASVRSVGYYSDNFYNQPQGETAGYGALLGAKLDLVKQGSRVSLVVDADAEYGMFNLPGSEDDYLDGSAAVALASQLSLRNQVRLDGAFKHGHDAFGVDRTEDAAVRDADLDRWNETQYGLRYRYGAPGARLNSEIRAGGLQKHYVTNQSATEPLNYDSTTVDYTVFYNYSSKTSALVDFSRSDFEFEAPFAGNTHPRGGELYRARAGMKWLATGKTSGDVRVGYRRRLFDAGTAELEGVDWEAGIDWAPAPRATIRLETARSEQESYTDIARLVDVRSIGLRWKYNVTSKARTSLGLEHLSANFEGNSGRRDKIYGASASLEYLTLGYVWMVGNLGLVQRDSTFATREYDRINAFVGVRLGR